MKFGLVQNKSLVFFLFVKNHNNKFPSCISLLLINSFRLKSVFICSYISKFQYFFYTKKQILIYISIPGYRSNLTEKYSYAKKNSMKLPQDPLDLQIHTLNNNLPNTYAHHFLVRIPAKGSSGRKTTKMCTVCSKNGITKKTLYCCPFCNVALCAVNCYQKYHTENC